MTRRRLTTLVLILGGGCAALLLVLDRGGSTKLRALSEQEVNGLPPPILPAKRTVTPAEASAQGKKPPAPPVAWRRDGPGALALRAEAEVYCEYNRAAVAEKARKEGLTPDEVKELTLFGIAAMRTAQPAKVEQVLGRALAPDERHRLGEMLDEENDSFKKTMRLKVQGGASVEERWRFIREYESLYIQSYMQTFGMTPAQFDQMLGSEFSPRTGATPMPLPAEAPKPAPEPARTAPPDVPPDDPQHKPEPAQRL